MPFFSSSRPQNFIFEIEQGYLKNKNPYHNNMHAADVSNLIDFS